MKRLDIFFLIGTVFLLSLAGFNDVYGAAQASKSASSKNSGDLISLPGENAGSSKTKTTAAVPKTKYPRPNEMLQGVVYDLKRTKGLKPSGIQSASDDLSRANSFLQVTKGFVLGQWTTKIGGDGVTRYPDLDNYFCLSTRLANSFFYLADSTPEDAPRLLHSESDMNAGAWVGIWSGYVVAPFTGKFRFVGFGDDQLLVRFNKKIVLDYGWAITTMGIRTAAYSNIISNLSGSPADASQAQLIQNSPLYSSYRLETFPASYSNNWAYGLQRGAIQTVQKGQIIPIEILIGEIGDGSFSTALFVEQLDSKGRPLKNNPQKLPLFRTTTHLPPHSSAALIPDYEDDGPIWKVVDQFGKTIPAKAFAGQNVKIGLQLDDGTTQNATTVAAATTASTKTETANYEYEDELPGVLYDLKLTSDGESTGLMEMQEGKQFNRMRTILSVWNLPDTAGKESVMVPYLKRFVVSNWPHKADSTGYISFNEFKQFSRSPVNSYKSYFYQPIISSANAPKSYSGDARVSDGGWVAINSGYVVAPFTGKFRFIGFGDDALVVRFNNQIVLDYGWYALSLGKRMDDTWDWRSILGGTAAKTDPQNRMVLNNPVYSQCKLETYFPSMFDKHGLAKGVPISVTKGKHYPIQILVTDIESGSFGTALLIERLDSTGVPLKKDPAKLPLFRTSSALPGHSSGSGFPDFDDDSPIWSVVDSKGKPIPSHKQGSRLVVTTARDVVDAKDGLTSIREAISYAKTLGGVQTISFNMSDGDNVTINDPMLIYHELRFASTNETTGNAVTVTMDNLNISGRRCSSEGNELSLSGGTVLNTSDANIVVSGGKYTNNQISGRYGWGGVIRMIRGTLTVDGTIFDSNSSGDSGGAINCDSTTNVTIQNTHFKNNSASGDGSGGIMLYKIPASYLIDTDFVGNSTVENDYATVYGGAIGVFESSMVYEVTSGKAITNLNNESGTGGFIALTGEWANAEFKVNGTLNIGNGNGKDSFASRDNTSNKSIRKTGTGTMTINAPVSDYKGKWNVEDGILNMNYGGSFTGQITVNGGRMVFSKDYTITKLVVELDTKKKDAYIGGTNHLSGGKYYIVIDDAIPKGSYLLAEDVNRFNDPLTVQTKNGTPLGTLVVGQETVIGDGSGMLTLDGGKLSLSVLAPINSQKKANTDAASAQPQRDPNLKKTVTKTTRGNVTTETVTEYNGDTTIETVTTTEVNGDTTTVTTETTESRKGFVVKKTTTTTTTTGNQPASQSSNSSETEKAAGNSSSESNTTQKKNNPTYNPFGYTSPLMED